MPEVIICNTTPVYYLYRVGILEVLKQLYEEIHVPEAVVRELDRGKRPGYSVPEVREYRWIKVRQVRVPAFMRIVADLGEGEAEALALASETEEPLLIMDDRLGRELAESQTYKVTGTIGVMLRAKERGLIKAVFPYLKALKAAGFYISDEVAEKTKRMAGE